ncbi:mitochondrial import inner membrane translocase subunit Tim9 isoform a [Pimephales promelas]|nr:mitochondrial import inner membrane translocase subunit Tim9 isoform a [Pimephales promelas]
MDPDGQLRNLRDFLLVYNRMTEICFQRCTSNFNYRNLTMDEERCVDSCASKLIRTNHRLMGTYVQLMPAMVQKRMQEMESKAAEVDKAEVALENPSTVITDTYTESPSTLEIPATSSSVPRALKGRVLRGMSECLSVGRRSQTRALVGCGRWKSVGPDCPSHNRWSTPAESGHINSYLDCDSVFVLCKLRTPHLSFLLVSTQVQRRHLL